MSKRKKTWREKLLDDKDLPKVVPITGKLTTRWGEGTVAIPAPREVDALMQQVPPGQVTTINELREQIAACHRATVGCPITIGIFAWIAAHAAEEAAIDEGAAVTPYWRTLKSGGELNPKYPGGIEYSRTRLEAEGHQVIQRGTRWFVADYEKRLALLTVAQQPGTYFSNAQADSG